MLIKLITWFGIFFGVMVGLYWIAIIASEVWEALKKKMKKDGRNKIMVETGLCSNARREEK